MENIKCGNWVNNEITQNDPLAAPSFNNEDSSIFVEEKSTDFKTSNRHSFSQNHNEQLKTIRNDISNFKIKISDKLDILNDIICSETIDRRKLASVAHELNLSVVNNFCTFSKIMF